MKQKRYVLILGRRPSCVPCRKQEKHKGDREGGTLWLVAHGQMMASLYSMRNPSETPPSLRGMIATPAFRATVLAQLWISLAYAVVALTKTKDIGKLETMVVRKRI